MEKKFLLTAFSKDRPGIVADLSQVIYEIGYNLEDSSMTYLAGEFAILLLLSTPTSANNTDFHEQLSAECRRLEREKGITAFIRQVDPVAAKTTSNLTKNIYVEGLDHSGIVYKVTRYLADNNINIITLNSVVKQSPESGGAIYCMTLAVEIPADISLQAVEDGLHRIGDQLHVDVDIQ